MAVVLHAHDGEHTPRADNRKCNFCGGLLSYPFLWWRDREHIHLCGRCCETLRSPPFVADLIQVTAIRELHKLDSNYRNQTLQRTTKDELEKPNDDLIK